MNYRDRNGVTHTVTLKREPGERYSRAWFADGRELTDGEMERLNRQRDTSPQYTCDVAVEAEHDGQTFELTASLSCAVVDDSFDHEFGTETVAPYPDEDNLYVEHFDTSPKMALTDDQVLEIIREQFNGQFRWE